MPYILLAGHVHTRTEAMVRQHSDQAKPDTAYLYSLKFGTAKAVPFYSAARQMRKIIIFLINP